MHALRRPLSLVPALAAVALLVACSTTSETVGPSGGSADATGDAAATDTAGEDAAAEDTATADTTDDAGTDGPVADATDDATPDTPSPDADPDTPVDPGPAKCGDGTQQAPEACDEGDANTDLPCEPVGEATTCSWCTFDCQLQTVERPLAFGRIEGYVLAELDDAPIEGATVSVRGGDSATTDATGAFALDRVRVGERVLVDVAVATDSDENPWSTTQVPVPVVDGETSRVYPRLLRGCSDFVDVGLDAGGTAESDAACAATGGYARIAIPASGLVVEADGAAFSGTARVDMIPMPLPRNDDDTFDLSAWSAFPGDMEAVRADGTAIALQSYGAVEFRVTDADSGAALQVAPGAQVALRIPVYLDPDATTPVTGWVYDTSVGRWVEEAAGRFVVEDGVTYYDLEVEHLSWWNCDEPLRNKTCIWGSVQSQDGGAFPRLPVTANGIDYAGTSRGYTDRTGEFCVDVRPNSLVALDIPTDRIDGLPGGFSSVVESGNAGVSCRGFRGDCLFVGTLPNEPVLEEEDLPDPPDLPPPPPPDLPDSTCLQVGLTTPDGAPVGTDVTVTAFNAFVTPIFSTDLVSEQSTGALCVNVPGTTTRVSFEWESPDGRPCLHTQPITVGTDELACSTGGCIDVGALDCGF